MPLTILEYGDCTSYNGQIRENVDYRCQVREVSLYQCLKHCHGSNSSDSPRNCLIKVRIVIFSQNPLKDDVCEHICPFISTNEDIGAISYKKMSKTPSHKLHPTCFPYHVCTNCIGMDIAPPPG